MTNKSVEEKIKINNLHDLLTIQDNSWVKINGREEFKIKSDNLTAAKTLSMDGNYICKNTYYSFLASMTPGYIEKFLKGTNAAATYINILKLKGGLEL